MLSLDDVIVKPKQVIIQKYSIKMEIACSSDLQACELMTKMRSVAIMTQVITLETLQLKIIPFAEWRREIAPLWLMDGAYRTIHPTTNGHGQMQYAGREIFKRTLLYPITAEVAGERVGWTSIYNISDEAVRVRGIYVLPEFRSNGIGHRMVRYAISLWPLQFKRCFMYARGSNIERYQRWGFMIAPGHIARSWKAGKALDEREIVLMQKDLAGNSGDGEGAAAGEI